MESSANAVSMVQVATTQTPQPDAIERIALDVSGMKCAGCVKAVENKLSRQSGVVSACVNLVTAVAMVECQPGSVKATDLAQHLTESGFPTQPRDASHASGLDGPALQVQQQEAERQQLRQLAIAAMLVFLSSLGHLSNWVGGPSLPLLSQMEFHWALATLTLLGPARSLIQDGWRGLRHNVPNMNTLVGLGAVTAYLASCIALLFPNLGWECFFDEPVMLLSFILLGRTLEQRARGRAAAAYRSLLALQPKLARLIGTTAETTDQTGIEIPADRLRVGEWVQVLPGEAIPADGEVVIGQSTVNESMLTGEATPVLKQPQDPVSAGTLNLSGAIAVKVTRIGQDTTLARIIELVEAAQARKAPIQSLADTVAGYFTYTVMALAALTFCFWYFAGTNFWPGVLPESHPSSVLLSLKLAIAVLVVACPCALGLATPTAILVGSSLGAEQGLLIRGGDVLERVHNLDAVVFDKTGTLTSGHPVLTDCLPVRSPQPPLPKGGSETLVEVLEDRSPQPPLQKGGNGSLGGACPNLSPENQLLQLAATVDSGTHHPLADAICQRSQQESLSLLPVDRFHTEAGMGVSAYVEGQQVLLGNQDWLAQQGVAIAPESAAQAITLAQTGKTVIYLSVDGKLAGLLAASDPVRPDAEATIAELRQLGLHIYLLTGDQPAAAATVAQQLHLAETDVFAGVRPAEKAATIAKLQDRGYNVAMVGDGINDAPALAQADVGISLRSSTDVAAETAQIVLMRDRVADVLAAIRLSRATFRKIRQNLFWAFAYNVLGLPLAAGALLPIFHISLTPAIAGAMMAFSSVSVVTNSLLLRQRFTNRAKDPTLSGFEIQ